MFSSDAKTAEADYTLARLYEEGTDALTCDKALLRANYVIYKDGERVALSVEESANAAIQQYIKGLQKAAEEQDVEVPAPSELSAEEADPSGPIPKPKDTYEVAEGVVGTMPFPRLGIRERMSEIAEEYVQPLFKDDAEADDIRALGSKNEEERSRGAQNSIREGITTKEWKGAHRKTNCLQTIEILEFDGEAPDPEDVNPQMASVVVNHFTALRPGTTNGHSGS